MNLSCLFLIAFLLILQKSLSTDSNYYDKCKPYECGEMTIRYPFYDPQKQFHLCGTEGFEVSCNSNNQTTIKLDGDAYTVNSISYQQLTINITNSAFLGSVLGCPSSLHNLTLDGDTRFNFTKKIKSLILLQNCTREIKGGSTAYTHINCTEEEEHQDEFLALNRQDVRLAEGLGCEEAVEVPYENEDGALEMEGRLRRGIVLNYEANNCSVCQESGGRCGFNPSKDMYCFCPDRAHRGYCHPDLPIKTKQGAKIEIILVCTITTIIVALTLFGYWFYRKKSKEWAEERERSLWLRTEESDSNSDLPVFSLSAIVVATQNFDAKNKLGEGGFGAVYKGTISSGQEIAVKRLSKHSGQGIEEFKNEVRLIAKLQHRNLVKTLGCCVRGDEKMLIYEFLPNTSLDKYIFDEEKRLLLDWNKRFDIILGIARGILYLHQDSRLRIIHRDLKTSNILLDATMTPKISDFGMARIFENDQNQANTKRVVGTYGYMSPEYAMEGIFSIKSDVFSFGVMVLELVTSQKSSGYYNEDLSTNLIGYIWKMWQDGKAMDVVDPSILSTTRDCRDKIIRCIQIGLICAQENPNERPTILEVIFMLSNNSELPSPSEPAFITKRSACNNEDPVSSVNNVTGTVVEAR